MDEVGERDGCALHPGDAFADKDRIAFPDLQKGSLIGACCTSHERKLGIGERGMTDEPFVRPYRAEIRFAGIGDGVQIDPAIFELIGDAVCQMEAANMQHVGLRQQAQPRTDDFRCIGFFHAQKPVSIFGTARFDLLADAWNDEAGFPNRVEGDAGACAAFSLEDAGAGQLLQSPVDGRSGGTKFLGQRLFAGYERSRKPDSLGDAPGKLVAYGAK